MQNPSHPLSVKCLPQVPTHWDKTPPIFSVHALIESHPLLEFEGNMQMNPACSKVSLSAFFSP